MVIGELEFVVTRKLICVASVQVPLVTIEAIPVVFLYGRGALMHIITRPLITFRRII